MRQKRVAFQHINTYARLGHYRAGKERTCRQGQKEGGHYYRAQNLLSQLSARRQSKLPIWGRGLREKSK